MKKNICVIFGGKSTEHDISILTANQVINALNVQKYNVLPVYINQQGMWFYGKNLTEIKFFKNINYKKLKQVSILPQDNFLYIKKFGSFKKYLKIDCAVICCHGKNGEDGTLQGLLELAGVPYTSSGVLGSSVGLDKLAMKQMFTAQNIPVCDFCSINKKQYEQFGVDYVLNKLDLPVIVKPNTLGSSIGISVAKDKTALQDALELAFLFDDVVVIEKLIEDITEVNISLLGDAENCNCSVTEQPTNKSEFLTFKDKYMSGSKQVDTTKTTTNTLSTVDGANKINGMQNLSRLVPANISKQNIKTIEELAKQIFILLNCKGVVRIDFIIDNSNNTVYANEINTIPGSFAFYLWQQNGLKFEELLDKLIVIAEENLTKQNKLTTIFNTSVLSQNCKLIK